MKNKNNIIGLIGGMGPYASAYFYKLLLDKSGKDFSAKNNDDYPEVVIDSIPVPDFISDTKQMEIAKKMLISRVERLNKFGCNYIGMICNTGHLLHPELKRASNSEFVSLIDMVAKRVRESGMKRVGLLATKTTIRTGLYHKALEGLGVKIIGSDNKMIAIQDHIIRDVIAHGETNKYEKELADMTEKFIKKEELDGVILGCTELPLVFPKNKFKNVIDCLDVLADSLLSDFYSR